MLLILINWKQNDLLSNFKILLPKSLTEVFYEALNVFRFIQATFKSFHCQEKVQSELKA